MSASRAQYACCLCRPHVFDVSLDPRVQCHGGGDYECQSVSDTICQPVLAFPYMPTSVALLVHRSGAFECPLAHVWQFDDFLLSVADAGAIGVRRRLSGNRAASLTASVLTLTIHSACVFHG